MAVLPLRSLVKPARAGADAPPSRLSPGIRITGHMDVDGEIVIDGRFSGRLDAQSVVVGKEGNVEADIVARDVRIAGRFDGRVFAHHVTIAETAQVTGRIFHHTIAVEKGARIDARMPWRPLNYFETLDQLPETRS